jgi:hypothetical protein
MSYSVKAVVRAHDVNIGHQIFLGGYHCSDCV